jgi:hypothetical protein
MNKFWMVYADGKTGSTYKHSNLDSAMREAERLAQLPRLKGVKIYVLQVVDCCHAPKPVVWESQNQIPF